MAPIPAFTDYGELQLHCARLIRVDGHSAAPWLLRGQSQMRSHYPNHKKRKVCYGASVGGCVTPSSQITGQAADDHSLTLYRTSAEVSGRPALFQGMSTSRGHPALSSGARPQTSNASIIELQL
jgi:hypothetical protein